jgi:hypothetical protein
MCTEALVIGASDYQDPAWADLTSVPQDVTAVKEALEQQGFLVQTVMDPTESILLERINEFIDNYGYERGNRLLFYYAGHGYTRERNGRKFGYLVPVDAPSPLDNERDFNRTSIKMEQILSWARQIESKHALFLFDSCFSGSVLQSRAITVPEDITYSTSKPVRQFISAGSANQTVPAVSVFRPLFIRGINGAADLDEDGYVTGVELGMYLQKQVPYYESGQTPQYGKIRDPYLDEGNFVFQVGVSRPEIREEKETGVLYVLREDYANYALNKQDSLTWIKNGNTTEYLKYEGEISGGVPNGQGTLTYPGGRNYVGEFKDGKFHGQGTFTFPDGEKYVGEFKDGFRHGQGIYIFPDGEKYVGEWKDGSKHGQGTYTFLDGRKYTGEWKDGSKHGQGTFTFPDGAKYVGEFKDGLPNGQGTETSPDGAKYVGEWKDGSKHGQGTYTYSDGRKYTGEWKDGSQHGQGTLTFPDGEKYVGEFKDGKYNGQGTYTFPDGEKYVGEFKDDKRHGQGTLTYASGEKYVGEYKDDKRHGQGTYTFPDGRKYVGEFKDGKYNGQGTYTFPDGEKYVGEFKDDKRHGQGIYTFPDGRKYVGEFKDGKYNGQGTYTFPDGEQLSGQWENGEYLGN